ncbi:hypothetical protein [Calothrix rhizosoleniae]|uniref:hypothetical protein n=1 Tax=Calothrix rhizosoleniae TaxID=888997 RepID=UPI000B499967|nr:hypothetical protein [Calothrix rhizosoleniae]
MKTAGKLAAGWLLTLGVMLMTLSISAEVDKHKMLKPLPPGIDGDYQEFLNTEALYLLDITAKQGLIFGFPTLAIGGWLALGLYRQGKQEKQASEEQASKNLQSIFYRMVQENEGRISLLGFAMQSQLPPTTAKEYLDIKAQELNANFKVSEEGSVLYHFDA